MAGRERLICSSTELVDGGDGVRFQVTRQGGSLPAFVVRWRASTSKQAEAMNLRHPAQTRPGTHAAD